MSTLEISAQAFDELKDRLIKSGFDDEQYAIERDELGERINFYALSVQSAMRFPNQEYKELMEICESYRQRDESMHRAMLQMADRMIEPGLALMNVDYKEMYERVLAARPRYKKLFWKFYIRTYRYAR